MACAACPHAADSHDVIARRFCTATVAGGFHRGCVCVGGHDEPVKDRT
ncbi:RGCVC family protein [Amycolatopsis camponoti]|nr:RGCVC family protein [Amycolatopsis camponoti]